MKKLLLSVMAFVGVVSMNAQIADVESVTPLLKGVESEMHNPVLSADGSQLLFSECDYTGLRLEDFNDNVVVKRPVPTSMYIAMGIASFLCVL